MGRLINVDKLLEVFPEWMGSMTLSARLVRELINNQPIVSTEHKWIPVSERLPENDNAVLITHKGGVGKAWWNGRVWTSLATKKYKTVIAWMPLPEPYKPKEEGDE